MTALSLAFSPCPNDTFIFHALLHKLVGKGDFSFSAHIDDIEALNTAAFARRFQVTKLSAGAYLRLREYYELLDSGAAMGFGCGPLVVAAKGRSLSPGSRIAVPGANTTALLLLKSWYPELQNLAEERFDRILPGIKSGKYDAGLVIHEGRFIYRDYGCVKVADLGDWWEKETGCPIPLGCLAIRKDPDTLVHKEKIERLIADSVLYARAHAAESRNYIRSHAPGASDEIIDAHIKLYVNDYSVSMGETGKKAFKVLEDRCKENL
ncbi:MAG: 1,4-dihydroxy-6-naphthoate synthase [Elusimicrobiota bacterium]|nr:1,4-dihydroxy-6-naphthoate synthase [Elusimicrobiota bacterium]